jgi:Polyketide cyclase / dehydrase and lipid transport
MKLSTQTSAQVSGSSDEVFGRAIDSSRFPAMYLAFGPIPAIVRVDELGSGPALGSRRSVNMSDGSVIEEELVVFERPTRYGYRWLTRPKPPFGWLIAGAVADWTFTGADGGSRTRVDWVYTFTLTSPLAAPLALIVMAIFKRWMTKALERL